MSKKKARYRVSANPIPRLRGRRRGHRAKSIKLLKGAYGREVVDGFIKEKTRNDLKLAEKQKTVFPNAEGGAERGASFLGREAAFVVGPAELNPPEGREKVWNGKASSSSRSVLSETQNRRRRWPATLRRGGGS